MLDWTLALSIAVVSSVALTLFSRKHVHAWTERGFVNLLLPWNKTFLLSGVTSITVALLALSLGGEWWQAGLLSLLGWMLIFVCSTDFATYKIPSETSILAYLLPLALAIPLTWGDKTAYISFAVWMGTILLLDILGMILKGGIGGADIRLFILAGSTLSWWVGLDWMFYAFGASAALQLVVFLVARLTGWGRIKPAGSMNSLSASESKQFKADQILAVKAGTDIPKGRKVLPFGPSILATFLVMGLLAAEAGRDACSLYGGLICS